MSIQYITKIIQESEKAMEKDELNLLNDIHYIYEKKLKKIIAKKFHENSEKHEIFITINLKSILKEKYKNLKETYKDLNIYKSFINFFKKKGFKIENLKRKPVIYFFDIRENDKIEYYVRNLNISLEYIDKEIDKNTKYIYINSYGLYKNLLDDKLCRKYNLSKIEYKKPNGPNGPTGHDRNYIINPFYKKDKKECIIL